MSFLINKMRSSRSRSESPIEPKLLRITSSRRYCKFPPPVHWIISAPPPKLGSFNLKMQNSLKQQLLQISNEGGRAWRNSIMDKCDFLDEYHATCAHGSSGSCVYYYVSADDNSRSQSWHYIMTSWCRMAWWPPPVLGAELPLACQSSSRAPAVACCRAQAG